MGAVNIAAAGKISFKGLHVCRAAHNTSRMSTGMLAEAWMHFLYPTQIVQTHGNMIPLWGSREYWKKENFCFLLACLWFRVHLWPSLLVCFHFTCQFLIYPGQSSRIFVRRSYFCLFVATASAKALLVSDETERTMRVTWKAAPGPVVSYRLTYVPEDGGKEMTMKIPANVTSTMLRKLQPLTTYNIKVHPIYKRGEGKARQGVGTTRTLASNSKPMSHRYVQTQAHITTYSTLQKKKTFLQSILVLFSSTNILKFLNQESFMWEAKWLKISEKKY